MITHKVRQIYASTQIANLQNLLNSTLQYLHSTETGVADFKTREMTKNSILIQCKVLFWLESEYKKLQHARQLNSRIQIHPTEYKNFINSIVHRC